MTIAQAGPGVVGMDTQKVIGSTAVGLTDTLSVEEPLEIRLTSDVAGRRATAEVSVTMRTPGDGQLDLSYIDAGIACLVGPNNCSGSDGGR